jgi:hypothetical protein
MSWLTWLGDRVRRASIVSIARPAALVMLAGAIVFVALGSSANGTVTRAPADGAPAAGTAAPATATAASKPATNPQPSTRYSIVNGCYTVRSAATGAPIWATNEPVRMQAAALGVYLLYTPGGNYLVDTGGGTIATAGTPSSAAEWTVDGGGAQGFTITNGATGTKLPVKFVPESGCATYPEAGVDATGNSFTGSSPEGDVLGTVEGHAHVTAFQLFGGDWHCGRPWSPFGAPYALPASCAADEQGTNGEVEAFVDFGGATRPSGMHGWPTFVDWPSPTALAEEGDYYTGIERAWKAGLRVMVTNLVDNEALCGLMTTRTNPCNDMASVRIQSGDLYDLQNYIDAQSGGPGKGWFRIVTDPFQARQAINQGKLAVIEGIEVSRIFGCGEQNNVPECNESQIDAGLNEIHQLGVRTFFPVHEFNNAFGGSKMIAGDTGVLINAGNREETGSFFNLQSCPAQDQDAEQVTPPASGPLANLINGPLASALQGSALPVYGSGPQCNTQGLTDLGAYVIKQMIKDHYIIQLDHMDSKTAATALNIVSAAGYSGVVSAHCCSSPQLFKQIYSTGGFISEPVAPAIAFAATEKLDKSESDPKYHFGFGYGSDMNGLAEQPGPTTPEIGYPFKSYLGNVSFTEEQWGQRTFNYNTDGMANYGLYADWLNQLQQAGGKPLMNDMFQGAESYLEMWERADGVPATSCLPASGQFSSTGLGRTLRLGDSAEQALYRAGQPLSRPGSSYRYCVAGKTTTVASVFNGGGHVALIGSTASGDRAGGIVPGTSYRRLSGHAQKLSPGVWVGRRLRGGARYVYGVSGKRVSFVAVATAAELRSASRLRSDLRGAGL